MESFGERLTIIIWSSLCFCIILAGFAKACEDSKDFQAIYVLSTLTFIVSVVVRILVWLGWGV